MKSKKSILISACSMALVLSNAATVYATDDSRTVVNIRADLSNPNYSQKVEKIFAQFKKNVATRSLNLA